MNNQKLPSATVPSSPGSQTSQNTLKEDARAGGDGRKEISSGDVVQFGVEVLEQAKKGAQPGKVLCRLLFLCICSSRVCVRLAFLSV